MVMASVCTYLNVPEFPVASNISYKGSSSNFASNIKRIKPIKCQCCPDIETSQLICCANQGQHWHLMD